jgi:carbon-monoxide dehydrogenase small subunit
VLIDFTLNGAGVQVEAPPDITLLTLLRDYLGLTGTKEGCSVGECGACAVLMDGRLVNSCLVLAPQAAGSEVLTIEGIHAVDGGPNDMQDNFITYGAVQCGICIPGMVLAGEALLRLNPDPTRAEIRTALAGNLCRCTGYQQIVDAIEATARQRLQAHELLSQTPAQDRGAKIPEREARESNGRRSPR